MRNKTLFTIQKDLAYSLSICSVLIFIVPFILKINNGINSFNVFGDYLGLITGFAGVIVTITIFLIQNSSQDYSSQLMRITFFRQKYFAFILGYIFFSLIYYAYGITFNITDSMKLFAFIVSLGLIFNFIALLLFASYYMNILNIITEIKLKTIKYIESKAETKKLPIIGKLRFNYLSEKFIISLIRPIFDTLNKSVELNQHDVSSHCLGALDEIYRTYLKQTKDYKTLNDKIILELSDLSSMIIDSMTEYKNQKFMDSFPIFLGNIGYYTLKYRKNIGGINNHAQSISHLLVKIFTKCYKFDRTLATGNSIKAISRLVQTCIKEGNYRSPSNYFYHLKEISQMCLNSPSSWSVIQIQTVLNSYKDIINEYVLAAQEGKDVELNFLKNIFAEIFDVIKKSQEKFSSMDRDLIMRSVFNLESILVKISKINPSLPIYKKIPDRIFEIIGGSYIDLCIRIFNDKQIKPDFMFFSCVPEFIFVTEYVQKTSQLNMKHKELLKSMLSRLKYELKNAKNVEESFLQNIEDYFAVMIYSKNLELFEIQFNLLLSFYDEVIISEDIDEYYKNKVYGLLKLIGAFIYDEDEFKDYEYILIKKILPQFKDVKITRKSIPSNFEKYGYPTFKHMFHEWHIYPLSIWTQDFQLKIKKFINRSSMAKFSYFHDYLKKIKSI